MMRSPNFYTYAFLKTPDFTLSFPQGHMKPVELINGAYISAIVEPEISLESYQNNDEQVIKMALTHDRVICDIFRQTTILPLRFGTNFSSQASLLNYLDTHSQEYLEKLEIIQDKHEYTLKLIPQVLAEPEKLSVAGGRDYFLAKKQQYEHQKNFSIAQTEEKSHLINLITEIYQSSVVIQQQAEEVRAYLLVNRDDKALLLDRILSWQQYCPHWNLILGESLPPYHFI